MDVTAVIPLKGFAHAKERLSGGLTAQRRADLAAATASHVIATCRAAGVPTVVVTTDGGVEDLARGLGATPIPDPGGGLNAAAAAGVAGRAGWLVVHGDLPLLTVDAVAELATLVRSGHWVIAPSRDGGTNILGGSSQLDFAYGPGSFHRHLGLLAGRSPKIVVSTATAVEIDMPGDVAAAASLPGGAWLEGHLS